MVKRSLLSLLCALAIAPQALVAASSLNLTFDASLLGNPDLDTSNIYVTLAGSEGSFTYGTEAITFSGGLSNGYATSLSYSLADILANGLSVSSATSMTAYISYGSSAGFSQLASGTSPNFQSTSLTRFSQFEFSYTSGGGGGIDMTNISQFGGALKVETRSAGTTQAYIANGNGTTTTAQMFQAMAAASGNNPTAVYTTGGSASQYTRIIGSNVFTANNPYQTFNNYLGQIYDSGTAGTGGSKVALTNQIANLAPGAANGGQGSVGMVATTTTGGFTAGDTYNINYQMSAELVQVSAPSTEFPDGTYSVKITGTVYATPAAGGTSIPFSNVSVTIAADSTGNPNMTNFIYLQTLNAPIQYTVAGLDTLNAAFGASAVSDAITQKFTGDFGEAIAAGFANSTVIVDKSGANVALGTLTTYEWFNLYNQTAYSLAQPDNANNYNQYANVVYLNSPGDGTQTNPSQIGYNPFLYGSVYGTPYDDRFGLNLLTPDSNTDELHIILQPDGDLSVVPEPGTISLLVLGSGLALYLTRRHRRLAA